MSHIRSAFCGVNVPIGSDASSKTTNTINNNVIINKKEETSYEGDNVREVSDGVYVVYPDTQPEYQLQVLQTLFFSLPRWSSISPHFRRTFQEMEKK